HPSQTRRHVFTHAVTDNGVGRDTQRLPETGHGIFDREQRRLGKQRLVERPGVWILRGSRRATEHLLQVDPLALARLLPALARWVQDGADVDLQVRLEQARAAIDFLPEHGPPFVHIMGHARVVIADTGQQQDHRSPWLAGAAGNDALRVFLSEGGNGVRAVDADETPAMWTGFAPDAQGVSHVAQVLAGAPDQKLP